MLPPLNHKSPPPLWGDQLKYILLLFSFFSDFCPNQFQSTIKCLYHKEFPPTKKYSCVSLFPVIDPKILKSGNAYIPFPRWVYL